MLNRRIAMVLQRAPKGEEGSWNPSWINRTISMKSFTQHRTKKRSQGNRVDFDSMPCPWHACAVPDGSGVEGLRYWRDYRWRDQVCVRIQGNSWEMEKQQGHSLEYKSRHCGASTAMLHPLSRSIKLLVRKLIQEEGGNRQAKRKVSWNFSHLLYVVG